MARTLGAGLLLAAGAGLLLLPARVRAAEAGAAGGATVQVRLSEWKVQLDPASTPPGPVTFRITNAGTIPHAFEVEGHGVEKRTGELAPGKTATLAVKLGAGSYEVYCPIGGDSHKMLGMRNRLAVATGGTGHAAATYGTAKAKDDDDDAYAKGEAKDDDDRTYSKGAAKEADDDHAMGGMSMTHDDADEYAPGPKAMEVSGGGPVIQILPGPFPFADSARAVIESRPADQKEDLEKKARVGPYSNSVARIAGTIALYALDRGASGDSVAGTAEFKTRDGAAWKLVLDRVQTRDIPFNPRFGGVIMGLFYHGASGVHTPLVPTIRSSLALWAFGHLWRDGRLVDPNAMVHVMLLSRTRRTGDFALQCWDCSHQPIEELQLQITPAPGAPPFDAPGGFLFVNWEKSSGTLLAAK